MSLEKEIHTKFRNNYHKGLVNLYLTNTIINNHFKKMLKKYGIAPPQFNVLRILRGQYPKAVTVNLIKERMLDKNSDVSRIIERLKNKGLIERNECSDDRRQKDIKITQKGLDLLNEMKEMEKEEDKILSALDEKEIVLFNQLLDKIRHSQIK